MSLKQQIIDYAIRHWGRHFTGVSALSISERLSCSHEEALVALNELRSEGKGSMKEDVKLYPMSISSSAPMTFEEHGAVITSIFFPSKQVLAEHYFSSDLSRRDLPEYRIRLHKGFSQIHLLYFSAPVLRKYLDHPELYDVDDSVAGGIISLNTNYENQLSEDELDEFWFDKVRYGKRRLRGGEIVVTAILHDLAEMANLAQRHWYAHEVEEPEFSERDIDFARFTRRNFGGEFVDYQDPLEKSLNSIHRINAAVNEGKLFKKEKNAYLSYPVSNTYKDFCDSCSELYKVIGPDSLNINFIKRQLSGRFGYSEDDFLHQESGRPLSKKQLLNLFASKERSVAKFIEVLEEVKEHRVSADHRIIEPQRSNANYLDEFRRICQLLQESLISLHQVIEAYGE